jgi:hypothetical protein
MDPKDRAYLLRRLCGLYEPDRLKAVFNAAGPIPPGKIKVRDNTSPKGASIEEIAGKSLQRGTRLVSRRFAFAKALEGIDLRTKVCAVDREEQVLRPEAGKVLRGLRGGLAKVLHELRGGLESVDEALALRGELRDLLIAEIERGKPIAFSGGDWLNETVDRLQLLKWYANRVLVPPSPTGRPIALPPGLIPLIQHIWRDILDRRGGRTVGVKDNIPRGPLIDFTGACLGLVGIKLSADAINSHLARSRKWSKPAE